MGGRATSATERVAHTSFATANDVCDEGSTGPASLMWLVSNLFRIHPKERDVCATPAEAIWLVAVRRHA